MPAGGWRKFFLVTKFPSDIIKGMDNASQAVLKTIAYADIFDFSLTTGEIKQFLIASKRVDSRQIVKTLKSLGKKKIIGKKGDYYCLSGREAIIDERCERGQWTKRKIRLAQKSARLLKIVPWVEAVLLTGGVAKNNACQKGLI